jgi:hypothetical protein
MHTQLQIACGQIGEFLLMRLSLLACWHFCFLSLTGALYSPLHSQARDNPIEKGVPPRRNVQIREQKTNTAQRLLLIIKTKEVSTGWKMDP